MKRPEPHAEDSGWTTGFLLAAFAWIVIVLFIGTRPGDQIPKVFLFPFQDKAVHAILYGAMGFLIFRGACPSDPRRPMGMENPALFAFAMSAAIGLCEEVNQTSIPGRSGDPFDCVADALGAAIAVLVVRAMTQRRERAAFAVA